MNLKYTDEDIRNLEGGRLQSEIERNQAERDSLVAAKKGWWKPSLLAIAVLASFAAAFAGFFSDLHQIAITDRDVVRAENERLVKEVKLLAERSRLSKQEASAARALSAVTQTPINISEADIYGAVVVTRWGDKLQEAHAIILDPIKNELNGKEKFAHGSHLGTEQPSSDLGLGGGMAWSGTWTIQNKRLRIVETSPRTLGRGIVIEIPLANRIASSRWPAIRSRDTSSEHGVAEILFFPHMED